MLSELHGHVKKAGQPPGTPLYTGEEQSTTSHITVITYDSQYFQETTDVQIDALPPLDTPGMIWVHVDGLNDTTAITQLAQHYELHPLTLEDILNVEQRPKLEEFANYLFVTLKMLLWDDKHHTYSIKQFSLVLGKNFVLSFQDKPTSLFNNIRERLRGGATQRLRQKSCDYLAYRLIDAVVDQYFIILEGLADQIEILEGKIMTAPTLKNSRALYHLKRQLLMLRKVVWPTREVISDILQIDEDLITPFTLVYLRDVYDHTIQAIDTLETFRDMLSNILDVYLANSTNRMNEIMKVLTIIATIFIPITFIASVFGMNFKYMPELSWHWGYYATLGLMLLVVLYMLFYFRRKKWL